MSLSFKVKGSYFDLMMLIRLKILLSFKDVTQLGLPYKVQECYFGLVMLFRIKDAIQV
jgi:hypothetical protein